MRGRFFAAGLVGALLLAGCGGGGQVGEVSIAPGYYRGTLEIPGNSQVVGGSATMVADVAANGDFTAHAQSLPVQARVTKTGATGSIATQGTTIMGSARETVQGNQIGFTLQNGSGVVARGTMTPAQLPQLGTEVSLPPSGNYGGEVLVVDNGHVRAFSQASAHIDGSGNLSVTAGLGDWGDNLFGRVEANGTLSGAMVFHNGSITLEDTPPPYSFDGTTLIIRYDNLALAPGSAWIVVKKTNV
jgi:hypothetical protein